MSTILSQRRRTTHATVAVRLTAVEQRRARPPAGDRDGVVGPAAHCDIRDVEREIRQHSADTLEPGDDRLRVVALAAERVVASEAVVQVRRKAIGERRVVVSVHAPKPLMRFAVTIEW